MSVNLLKVLNGGQNGKFNQFLKTLGSNPVIAWYPSSGSDFRDLLFLDEKYAELNIHRLDVPAPQLFLHTDYGVFNQISDFEKNKVLYEDKRTRISIAEIEELPRLNLPLDPSILHFPKGGELTNRVFFLELAVESNKLGNFTHHLIYAFVENEAFCSMVALPNCAQFIYISTVKYGGGFSGGNAMGGWLHNILAKVGCKIFVTDERPRWEKGDIEAVKLYPSLGPVNSKDCFSSRVVYSTKSWSFWDDRVNWHVLTERQNQIEGDDL